MDRRDELAVVFSGVVIFLVPSQDLGLEITEEGEDLIHQGMDVGDRAGLAAGGRLAVVDGR